MNEPAGDVAVALKELRFAWDPGHPLLHVENLGIGAGEQVFLGGASGSGKSTLLALIGGVLQADSGSIRILGQDLAAMRQAARDRFRAEHVGFIFQQFNLLPYLSVLENASLACRFSGRRAQRAATSGSVTDAARHLLDTLGVRGKLLTRPVNALSIGQQQRVAAARALIGHPELLVADEPTSALDHDVRGDFLDLLQGECRRAGTTLLFVSHDRSLADNFDRQLDMRTLNEVAVEHV